MLLGQIPAAAVLGIFSRRPVPAGINLVVLSKILLQKSIGVNPFFKAELREKLPKLDQRLEQLRNLLTNVAQFIDKAKRYSDITELTPEILRLFIEKIVVGEKSQKYSRTAEQDIWIYYRDIGLMDTPVEQPKALEAELDEGAAILARPSPPQAPPL